MNCKYISSRLLFRHLKYISIFLFCSVVFLPAYVLAANMCVGTDNNLMKDIKRIACATSDLQEAVQKDDLLKKLANINFFASNDDPKDIVRGVEVLTATNQALKDRVTDFHEEQIDSGKMPYTVSVTAYPSEVKRGSCAKKYKTIDVVSDSMDYRAIEGKTPRSFEVRYDPKEEEFFMCENTNLSRSQRERTYCVNVKACKRACIGMDEDSCKDDCNRAFRECKGALLVSCSSADKKGAVTADKANEECLSLDDYSDLSKELFLGDGWFSHSNPALEQNCPAGCSYYTQTVQRVFEKDEDACSDNYVIVHCGPKKKESEYNLNIREVNNLCTDFNFSGCTAY